ncbi:MAG: phosphoribosylamine--glycine ligase [Nitriliruptorales bacterium]|nr:phosphoribosylamine--glycine ligase [Nitriliruptorales bacterium]
MKVLVVGGGGREHALAWRLAVSPSVDAVESAPGNPGMAELGPVHPDIDDADPQAVADLAAGRGIDLVVVGPEAPLVAGVADAVRERGILCFGPSAAAAEIEGSKSFAKDVMEAAGVATAASGTYDDRDEAVAALANFSPPYVVKADGLAAGKGVVIADDRDDAVAAIEDALVHGRFGEAGATVVLEAFLDGPEVSVFGVCDGTDVALLPPSQDFKRAYDGDEGPNTGGMGAYTPVPDFGVEDAAALKDSVFRPVLAELERRGARFQGLLYAGLVLTASGPQVLEFNCRFGDPETQSVIWRVASDFGDLLAAAADPERGVADHTLEVSDDAYVTVVLASGGYPLSYETGETILGLDAVRDRFEDVHVFHAGTASRDGQIVTAGGRVLGVTAHGSDVAAARERAYEAADLITWAGQHRRNDIAEQAARS